MFKYLILAVLFFILSPGVLLNIPPIGRKWWMTGQTSILSSAIHAIIFAVICYCLTSKGIIENFMLNKSYDNYRYFDASKKENNGKRCCLSLLKNDKSCPNKSDGKSNEGKIHNGKCIQKK